MYGSSFTFDGFKSEDLNLHIVSFNKENFIQVPISLANENISFEVEMAYADREEYFITDIVENSWHIVIIKKIIKKTDFWSV